MIAQLNGTVVDIGPTSAVLNVSGVGFQILCTPHTCANLEIDGPASLFTHLAVREDALTLYGFSTAEEREAFLLAQSVTGIGPKMALGIVAHLSPAQFRQAVRTENLSALSKVPGVGTKTAQRLVLELKDKVLTLPGTTQEVLHSPSQWQEQVVDGLIGLGYSAKDAQAAWERVAAAASDPSVTVSQLMKTALQSLAKG
ncbi:MAG: Holliday junction branch migration protein RuvA [Propionibacteriaceae bacterium]|nr:Holliday junction branch migration protein RuvA [Propionibacteriaceae bacterium]